MQAEIVVGLIGSAGTLSTLATFLLTRRQQKRREDATTSLTKTEDRHISFEEVKSLYDAKREELREQREESERLRARLDLSEKDNDDLRDRLAECWKRSRELETEVDELRRQMKARGWEL